MYAHLWLLLPECYEYCRNQIQTACIQGVNIVLCAGRQCCGATVILVLVPLIVWLPELKVTIFIGLIKVSLYSRV